MRSSSSVGSGSFFLLLAGPMSAIASRLDSNAVALTDLDIAANQSSLKALAESAHTGFQWILVWFVKIHQELRPKDYYSPFKNTIPKRNILVPRSITKLNLIRYEKIALKMAMSTFSEN